MTPSDAWLRPWRDGQPAAGLCALLLAGCASQAPLPRVDSAPPEPPAVALAAPDRSAVLADFQARQREAAEAAARRGHWAEAVWAWDVLLALRPRDAELLDRRVQAQQAAQAAAADRLQRARQAQQRNDMEAAVRLYLEVLAQAPAQAEAADALRLIERERVKRQHLGQLSRNMLTRRMATEIAMPAANVPTTAVPSSERNEVEHASLLAAQGEIDAAIAVLKPLARSRRPDPMARRMLSDLYYRQAEGLVATDRPAAIAALVRSVQLDPAHPKAAARLKELDAPAPQTQTTPPPPARPTTR